MATAEAPRARWRGPAPQWSDRAEPELSMTIAGVGAVAALTAAALIPVPSWWARLALVAVAAVAAGLVGAIAYMRLSRRRLSVIQVPRPATRLLLALFRRVAPDVMSLALLMRDGDAGRDRLVSLYTRPALSWQAVAQAAVVPRAERSAPQRETLAALGALALSQLARAAHLHGTSDGDRAVAEALYLELESRGRRGPVGRPVTGAALLRRAKAPFFAGALLPDERLYLAELQLRRGDAAAARATIGRGGAPDGAQRRLIADLDSPYASEAAGDPEAWDAQVNAGYRREGYADVRVAAGAGAPFDRVACEPGRAVDGGARVTVVVSSYSPGPELLTAVRSVLASTWQDLEVMVVDDCSPAGSEDVYARTAALDPRVRVERLATNGGTYGCRNFAMDHATGELITFHDSDDWMHPERIERQATYMLANPGVPATTTASVRTTDDLAFTHDRTPTAKVAEPSLMVRREQARERVGYFDPVRKGGDVEYRFRVAAAFGVPVPSLDSAPLTLQRVDAESLSGSEISRDWIHPKRRVYRRCFQRWHETTPGSRLRVEAQGERVFFAPRGLTAGPAGATVDVVVAVPFALAARDRRMARRVAAAVRRMRADGRSVALWPVELPADPRRSAQDLASAWADLLNGGGVDVVCTPDQVECDLLVVCGPAATADSAGGASVRAARATIVGSRRGDLPRGAEAVEVTRAGALDELD